MNIKKLSKNSLFVFSIGLMPYAFSAKGIKNQCANLGECADLVAKLNSQKYIFTSEAAKRHLSSSENLEFNKENAEVLFTKMLDSLGFARVKTNVENTFEIVPTREVSKYAIEKINCDAKTPPTLPETWDHFTLSFKFKRKEMAENAPRILSDLIPRTAHILVYPGSPNVYVTASAPVLKRMYEILAELDNGGATSKAP